MPNKMNWNQKLINRFWSKVNYPGNDQDCWEWTAATILGYGKFKIHTGKMESSHRLAFEYYYGQIPPNLNVLHKCDNPPCCNPEHLFLGTLQENSTDMVNKNRQAKGSMSGAAVLTENDVLNILKDINSGRLTSSEQISKQYNISKTTIHTLLSGKTWSHITNQFKTPLMTLKQFIAPSHRKLSDNDIRQIKIDLLSNTPYSISKKFNVDAKTILNIKQNKTFKNVV